jgi:chromate transporter
VDQVPSLVRVFAYLSFLTIGGGMAAFPEMRAQVVDVHRWLTSEQLVHVYSVGQMSPGPNMMMVAQVGELVSGFVGAVAAALAFFVPTGLLTFAVGRIWQRLKNWPWRDSIQKGLGPVAIGMAVAGLITFGKGAVVGWVTFVVALAAFVVANRTKVSPALIILCGAVVGVAMLR